MILDIISFSLSFHKLSTEMGKTPRAHNPPKAKLRLKPRTPDTCSETHKHVQNFWMRML